MGDPYGCNCDIIIRKIEQEAEDARVRVRSLEESNLSDRAASHSEGYAAAVADVLAWINEAWKGAYTAMPMRADRNARRTEGARAAALAHAAAHIEAGAHVGAAKKASS